MAMDPSQLGGAGAPGSPPGATGQQGPDPMTMELLAKAMQRKKKSGRAHGRPKGHRRAKKGK